jgi:hypothetical protein
MRKNVGYRDLTAQEQADMEFILLNEIQSVPDMHPIRLLLAAALFDYKIGAFKYDGPTFSKIRYNFWEVPAFIHDWRNATGYVSYKVDTEMFSIMIYLNYPMALISQRYILTRFTFLNIIRHKIKGTLKNNQPSNLFQL